MRRRTLVVLLLLVGGLLVLSRENARQELEERAPQKIALIPDYKPQRVLRLSIDRLASGEQIVLERDQAGSWYVVEPVAYPAFPELLATLLSNLGESAGLAVVAPDLQALTLDPPETVLEIGLVPLVPSADAELESVRVEIGGVDLDGRSVYVRVPGHPAANGHPAAVGGALVLAVSQALVNPLNRPLDLFRDTRLTGLRGRDVTRIVRSGSVNLSPGEGARELGLQADLEPDGWRRTDGLSVLLDPSSIGSLARGSAELRASSFVDDSPASLVPYGLDPPELRFSLLDQDGRPTVLRIGRRPDERDQSLEDARWYAVREGSPNVVSIAWRDMHVLIQPSDFYYDYVVVRALRESIDSVELVNGARTLVLTRGKGGWTVAESVPQGSEYPASREAVDDLLARLEKATIGAFLPATDFVEAEPAQAIRIQSGGAVLGGTFGPSARDPETGVEGRSFLRAGDTITALVEESFAGLLELELEDLRSKHIYQLKEAAVRSLVLKHGESEREYLRQNDTEWLPRGGRMALPPGSPFFGVLEPLLSLRVEEWLPEVTEAELADEVAVSVVTAAAGQGKNFKIGRLSGRAVCRFEDGQTAKIAESVHEGLLALFR